MANARKSQKKFKYNLRQSAAVDDDRADSSHEQAFVRADWYRKAARNWMKAGDLRQAIRDYNKAGGEYDLAAVASTDLRDKLGKDSMDAAEVYEKSARECYDNAQRLAKVRTGKWRGLAGTAAAAAIIGFVGAIIFLSSNLTGNVIGLNETTSNWIGGVLFVIGLVGAFAYFRGK